MSLGDIITSNESDHPPRKTEYHPQTRLAKAVYDYIDFKRWLYVTFFPAIAVLSMVFWGSVFVLFCLGYFEAESFPQTLFAFILYCVVLGYNFLFYLAYKRMPPRKRPVCLKKYERRDPHSIKLWYGFF